MLTRWKSALTAASAVVLVGAAPAGAVNFSPGSPGLGDPYFPLAGNGGYDVSHYSLRLGYAPRTKHLTGTAVITAKATQNLSQFDLDLRGFAISKLLVNGSRAAFKRVGSQELVIKPRKGLRAGHSFTVLVAYSGTPKPVTDPDGSQEGWIATSDGAFVVGEPQGSPGWYPVNDNPQDKATFDFKVTVPKGLTVMANGVLESSRTRDGRTTWVWRESKPMAPYLATTTLGRFRLKVSHVGRIPSYVAVDPTLPSSNVLAKLPRIVQFYASIYGRYPFDAVGAIVDNAPNVGYALETQTKPVFDRMPDEATLAHELSHQWLGDSVTLRRWPDIWLHEGFATWSEWIWSEHNGQKSAQSYFDTLYRTPASDTAFWTPPPGNPGNAAHLFDGTVYDRGGMTLQALRKKVGDDAFFRIMRTWVREHRYGNVTTAQFIALAEHISKKNLHHFFDVWLYQPQKPTSW